VLKYITNPYNNFFNLKGRTRRLEFWTYVIFIQVLFGIIQGMHRQEGILTLGDQLIDMGLSMASVFWVFAIFARRLNDRNLNGKYHAIVFSIFCATNIISTELYVDIEKLSEEIQLSYGAVCLIILLFYLYQTCRRGSEGENKYGEDPLPQKSDDYDKFIARLEKASKNIKS